MNALLRALEVYPPTTYARPLRICTRGQREYQYAWMVGGWPVPAVVLETTEEVDVLMREREAVRV